MEENKLNPRSVARIQAMKILYIADFNGIDIPATLKMGVTGFFNDNVAGEEEISPLTIELVEYAVENLEKIDDIIAKTIKNYSMSRLNLVDKAIIRIATAELMMGKLDKKIIINEALNITKMYSDTGDHRAVAFNNRLLDNISNNL